MSAKQDIELGISAAVRADRDAVVAACRRAADSLGKHARLNANSAKVTVQILPGLSQSLSKVSPVVGINLRPADDGRVRLDARVEKYMTTQSKLWGLIPIGPKQLVGRTFLRRFLNALETELVAVDSTSGAVRRRTAA